MLARIAALGLALLAPCAAFAAPLAPAKASDLVVVYIKDPKTTCPGGIGKPFDTRVLPDGTEEPFVIPPKRVFVITSFAFAIGSEAPAGEVAAPSVIAKTTTTSAPLLIATGTSDSNGDAAGTFSLPNGVAVRPGPTLCMVGGTTPNGILHGFFAKDK
jgi:hypothetical protein